VMNSPTYTRGGGGSAPATAAEQLQSLNAVEEDIARVLRLASQIVSLLTIPVPPPEDEEPSEDEGLQLDSDEREARLNEMMDGYFRLLEGIHLTIRTTLATLRAARVSPALLMESADKEPPSYGASLPRPQPNGTKDDGEQKLGLYEKRAMRDAWVNVAKAMEQLKERGRELRSKASNANGQAVEEVSAVAEEMQT